METISEFMEADHRRCDEFFVTAEGAASQGDWDKAQSDFKEFRQAIEQHFAMEEQALFPRFEEASGNPMGPTQVMRHEHEQMRELFDEMADAVAAKNEDDFLGSAETLLILMQQHNRKEESILYPMSDQVLAGERESLLERMRATEV